MKDREKIFCAFLVKSVYEFPTTKLLIENLKTNPGLRRLCGWEYSGAVPSEAFLRNYSASELDFALKAHYFSMESEKWSII